MDAIVIFSGGQDSTTCLYWAIEKYENVIAVSFNYNQKHIVELRQAKKIANNLNIEHKIIDLHFLSGITNSGLFDEQSVKGTHVNNKDLPSSFVPNRNAMLITIAHTLAQKLGIGTLVTGVNQTDYSGYPDCRFEFIYKIKSALNYGSASNIKIEAPLLYLSKAEIFKLAEDLNCLDVIVENTHTCYNGVRNKMFDWGCGCEECPACVLRKNGWDSYIRIRDEVLFRDSQTGMG